MAIYEVNHLDLNNLSRLTDLEYSYRLPRFIPNTNQLILLKRRPYGPHMDCDQLVSFDLGEFSYMDFWTKSTEMADDIRK